MLHRRFPSLLPPPPHLALSATPLHPHLPFFSFSLPALFLSERKDLAGKEAQSIEASGKTKRRPFTAPPLLAVSDVSPGHPEGGQLPGSLFQKGWHAGQGASACDAPALRASSSHTPPQKAGWLLGPCSFSPFPKRATEWTRALHAPSHLCQPAHGWDSSQHPWEPLLQPRASRNE